MMRHHAGFIWVIVALFSFACGQSAPSDEAITASIKAGLAADTTIRSSQVDVITKDRVVTLNGSVDTPAVKEQAVRIARQTDGVRDIVDNLRVQLEATGTAPAPAAEPSSAAAAAAPPAGAGAAVGEAAKETEATAGDTGASAGRPVIDAAKTAGTVVVEAGKTTGAAIGEAGKATGAAVGDAAVTTGKATAEGAEAVAGGAKKLGTGIAGAITGGDKEEK